MLKLHEIAPETPRALTRSEYERIVELGLFEGERVELLYGVLIRMSPHGPEHDSALEKLTELLVRQLHQRARVRIQSSFAASDGSEPEPDVAVVPLADYSAAHPMQAFLIIEVAKSSLAKDRGLKARLYAECGVPEYWVVNLVEGVLEVFSEPLEGLYRQTDRYAPGDVVAAKGIDGVEVAVSEILTGR